MKKARRMFLDIKAKRESVHVAWEKSRKDASAGTSLKL